MFMIRDVNINYDSIIIINLKLNLENKCNRVDSMFVYLRICVTIDIYLHDSIK